MADIKINDLTAYTNPVSTDVLPIVDIGNDLTKKIEIRNLLKNATGGSATAPSFSFDADPDTGMYKSGTNALAFTTAGNGRLFINSSGNVGIGISSPGRTLDVNGVIRADGTSGALAFGGSSSTPSEGAAIHRPAANELAFVTNSTERLRIDDSGRLLVGTSTAPSSGLIQASDASGAELTLARNDASAIAGNQLGRISWFGNDGGTDEECGRITCEADLDHAAGDKPSRLVFSTTADGASSPTERWRIDSTGTLTSKTSNIGGVAGAGVTLETAGLSIFARSGANPVFVNRITDDGNLIQFYGDNTQEGSISISGTTVSYDGAHLSRWSQLPSGEERTEILRGSVLSNIDEMCEWGDEDNEQLNRMKVSDVEGDKNVSGVFQAWDDDDDIYTNDFYCAMTGDFIIRIAAGVTVERGDLLMSAGDGTAKPQDDDIIRSKTIAKVTSTNVSCTYEDGSYCVPCVLMAC